MATKAKGVPNQKNDSKKTKKKILALAILIILALVITTIAVMAVNHFNGPVRLVNRYIESINSQNGSQFLECFPPSQRDELAKTITAVGGEKKFFQNAYDQSFNDSEAQYDSFGENVTILVSDEDATQQEIEGDLYRGIDISALDASSVATVSCTLTTKGSLREESEEVEFTCVKIDGTWYLLY